MELRSELVVVSAIMSARMLKAKVALFNPDFFGLGVCEFLCGAAAEPILIDFNSTGRKFPRLS